jgi:hypothetical protein
VNPGEQSFAELDFSEGQPQPTLKPWTRTFLVSRNFLAYSVFDFALSTIQNAEGQFPQEIDPRTALVMLASELKTR